MADATRKPGDCVFDDDAPVAHNDFLIQRGALKSDADALVWMISPAADTPRERKAALLDSAKALRDVNAASVARVLGVGSRDGHAGNGYVILARQALTLADLWADAAAAPDPGAEAMQQETRDICRALGALLQGLAFLHEQDIVLGSLDPSMIEVSRDLKTVAIACLPLVPLDKGRMLRWSPAFQSPESFRDEDDLQPESDIYALGMIAWAWLIGPRDFETAFLGEDAVADRTMAWKNWHRSPSRETPSLPDHRPVFGMERVESVLEQMVRRGETGARHTSALDALADLDATLQQLGWSEEVFGDAVTVILPTAASKPTGVARATRSLAAAGVSAAVLIAGAGGFYYFSTIEDRADTACTDAYQRIAAVQQQALDLGPAAATDASHGALDGAIASLRAGQALAGRYLYPRAESECRIAGARADEARDMIHLSLTERADAAGLRADAARDAAETLGATPDLPAFAAAEAARADAAARDTDPQSRIDAADGFDTATRLFEEVTALRETKRAGAVAVGTETRALARVIAEHGIGNSESAMAGSAALDDAERAMARLAFDEARAGYADARALYARALENQLADRTAVTVARTKAEDARTLAMQTPPAPALSDFEEAERLRGEGEAHLAARSLAPARAAFEGAATHYAAAHRLGGRIAAWNGDVAEMARLAEAVTDDATATPARRAEARAVLDRLDGAAPPGIDAATDPVPAYHALMQAFAGACGWRNAELADEYAAIMATDAPDYAAARAMIERSEGMPDGCVQLPDCALDGLPGHYVAIPAGRYAVPDTLAGLMGEGLRTVAVDAPFCIAAEEVRLADYAAYLDATGAAPSQIQAEEWPDLSRIPPGQVADAISLADAGGYAGWLSRETGRAVALPTPMEWAAAHAYLSSKTEDTGAGIVGTMRAMPREWTEGDCSAANAGVQSLLMGAQKGRPGMASCSTVNKQVPRIGARLVVREAAR